MTTLKSYSLKSSAGPWLKVNEDDAEVDLVNNFFFIADGFGGANIGDAAVRQIKHDLKKKFIYVGHDPDATMPFFYSPKYMLEANALVNAFHYAHKNLNILNASRDITLRAGASVLSATFYNDVLTIVSAGACHAYLVRQGYLKKLVIPDSMDFFTTDEHEISQCHSPLSGLGLFEDLHLQIRECRLAKGDLVVFLTDGAFSRLDEEELRFLMNKKTVSEIESIEEVFELCNQRGNKDNQSAIILQF